MKKIRINFLFTFLLVAFTLSYALEAEFEFVYDDIAITLNLGTTGTDLEAPPMAPSGAFDARIVGDDALYFSKYENGGESSWNLQVQYFDNDADANPVTMTYTISDGDTLYLGDVPFTGTGTENIDWENQNANQEGFITQTITLQPGWNLVSMNVDNSLATITNFFSSIDGNYDKVAAFIDGGYQTYTAAMPVHPWDVIDLQYGYWINITSATEITLNIQGIQIAPNTPLSLNFGWNLITYYPTSEGNTITNALSNIAGDYDKVAAFIDGGYQTYTAAMPVHPWDEMDAGLGYWINITNPDGIELIYNY